MCSGCGACAEICPKHAIHMSRENDGFLYPVVDRDKCIQCNLCQKVCDFNQFCPTKKVPECYAVRHRNVHELQTSRSGGFFMALCKYVIGLRGVVFGCELTEKLDVVHCYYETYEECKRFKGSKYVQSDLKSTFSECEAFLRSGRWVLYSGTGCQVYGLLCYLNLKKAPLDTLITVDIVCHGTPSPGVWKTYVNLFEKNTKDSIRTVDFRDKTKHGWTSHVEKYMMSDGNSIIARNWTNVFYRHVLFRESCHFCPYTTTERCCDFTIADYWGIERNIKEFADDRGCSLVLIHTDKGKMLFESVQDIVDYRKTNLQTSMQPQLSRPVRKGWDRGIFRTLYKNNPELAVRLYFFPPMYVKIIWYMEGLCKMLLKRILRRK